MTKGRLVIALIALGVVAGGSWLRASAWSQWESTQRHYAAIAPQWRAISDVHARARLLNSARRPLAIDDELAQLSREIKATLPPNGRTMRTQAFELAYLKEATAWASGATPSLMALEKAYGSLVGQVRQENPSFVFATTAASGTLPLLAPRRLF